MELPKNGRTKEDVLSQLRAWKKDDVRWQDGKVFSLVYSAGEEAQSLLKEAYTLFFSDNMLNPTAYPSLRRCETEVVAMGAALLGGDAETAGNMTSGGTESILMAVVTAREWAKVNKPHITRPEMLLPASAHPAFDKAAHYFGVKAVRTPLTADWVADVAAVRTAVTPNTILIVGSAPAYPHGVVDPIADLAQIAQARTVLCHVDACVGGFMLPFVRQLGYPVPDFDFQVPGVTSISADLHKYGYAAKGASLILYRNRAIRRHQLFATTDWPGGIYASPTMGGTRPGGTVAAAWAIMNHLGRSGYLAVADEVMKTVTAVRDGIIAIPGIQILGQPVMSILAIASDSLDIYEVGDEMGLRGWHIDRQHYPPSLHLTINFTHVGKETLFLQDLTESIRVASKMNVRKAGNKLLLAVARTAARWLPERWVSRLTVKVSGMLGPSGEGMPERSAPMYGMMGSLPNRGDLKDVVLDFVEDFTQPQ